MRKKENRVKFLMGAFLLDKVIHDQENLSSIFEKFKQYLTCERDQEMLKTYFKNVKTERAIT